MAQARFTESDEGMRVVDEDGNEIGVVSGFRGGKVFVEPDPGVTDAVLERLGWKSIERDEYALDHSDVETVIDDEIRVQR